MDKYMKSFKIIEYTDEYLEAVRDLLVELEEYILALDRDGLDRIHPEYREKMALEDLRDAEENGGICFLAIEDGRTAGLVIGRLRSYSDRDYLDYKCPKTGVITELIVTLQARGRDIGRALTEKMEDYFRSIRCEYVMTDVFAYNGAAAAFYENRGYHPRMITDIKKL